MGRGNYRVYLFHHLDQKSPVGIQSQTFWGQDPRVGVSGLGYKMLACSSGSSFFSFSLYPSWLWVTMPGVGFLARPCLFLSCPCHCSLFIVCYEADVQLVLWLFSEGTAAHVAVYFFVCLWQERSSGLSYATILNCILKLRFSFNILIWARINLVTLYKI